VKEHQRIEHNLTWIPRGNPFKKTLQGQITNLSQAIPKIKLFDDTLNTELFCQICFTRFDTKSAVRKHLKKMHNLRSKEIDQKDQSKHPTKKIKLDDVNCSDFEEYKLPDGIQDSFNVKEDSASVTVDSFTNIKMSEDTATKRICFSPKEENQINKDTRENPNEMSMAEHPDHLTYPFLQGYQIGPNCGFHHAQAGDFFNLSGHPAYDTTLWNDSQFFNFSGLNGVFSSILATEDVQQHEPMLKPWETDSTLIDATSVSAQIDEIYNSLFNESTVSITDSKPVDGCTTPDKLKGNKGLPEDAQKEFTKRLL